MRKRNCDKLFDNIFWYTLYALPIIIVICGALCNSDAYWTMAVDGGGYVSAGGWLMNELYVVLDEIGYGFYSIYDAFDAMAMAVGFNGGGTGNVILMYFSYFISVYILHLFVDFILFLPRLAHKWLKKGYQED